MNRALLATCVAAAARAAEIIRDRSSSRETIQWEVKSRADYVSDVDRAAEHAIGDMILSRHADAKILGEELSPAMNDRAGLVFVVDPLDGTTNFLHGVPWYAVSVAAMVDDVLRAGVVLNVANGELFTATAGGGARLGGQPIAVSPIVDPLRSLIGTGFPFKGGPLVDEYLRILPNIMRETSGLRRPGAASLDLAAVACGRFEGFWELELSAWDIAAGILLIREAGGIVTDLHGAECPVAKTGLVAGCETMHAWLMERVRRV
ncbi:MAG TPA: inositol monophosphatase family protein [Gemmatimonadaceae bacterium]|jgi:myo-inositol-1(or 4)-monophosphatase|nr:inositol monophosphatase family protein [Gemmatimonadaceae bacterium]